ncbi:GATA zinc finger domain-containing protein 14-like [Coccinella septempunctata]|uniref:GATA zinc finger domain-containing protein 14-like n=1 Tax=Coccinella septempunctata TaxID=41139 RepID=UPI001D092AE5|nr:GATA zinc finger domain-containing protein 14-like [Coccinella septempunctata]
MRGVCVLFMLVLYTACGNAQFLNNRPFPTYSLENMPDTEFSCRDKILGGYYADVDAQCQMFHICVKVAGVGVQDFRFLCPNGTAFDQDHQICAEWEDVDCDATTLYYSSDNFDLYRIGSGFESKAKKYGEDEETFALQRAETGDVRLNREHQTQRVNQQKENNYSNQPRKHHQQQQSHRPNNNQENERDIFKGSSSSNFFNNRNGGKETDEDYDDNVNANQNNDQFQKRKLNKKPVRRPSYNNQQQETTEAPVSTPKRVKQTQPRNEENQTNRPQKPTGFINNFAGSSYVPTTTPRGTTTLSNERYTVAVNNHRVRNSQRHRAPIPDRQYNNADNFRQSQSTSEPLTVSTPAPFRQSNQYNNSPSRQSTQFNNNYNNQPSTSGSNKQTTQNYPRPNNQQKNEYNDDFETKKTTENYPQRTNFDAKKSPAPFQSQNDNYPTTYSPKKQFYQTTTKKVENYPTTFSPKTNQGYNTISQVTTQYNNNQGQNNQKQQQNNYQNNQQQFNTQKPQPFSSQKPNNFNSQPPQPFSNQKSTNYNQFSSQKTNRDNQQSTPKTTPYTQYTPTVPKITSTTPINRSNRFDETQYDDGTYNSRYDYDDRREDEFLKTAHSQNIAKSRNDLAKSQKAQEQSKQSNNKPNYESPRPFSATPNASTKQDYTRPSQPITPRYTQQQTVNKQRNQQQSQTTTQAPKKVKDVSYDYAYYDTNGSEPEYDIDTEIKKSTAKN